MSDKCTLDGNLINRCDMLAKALEYGNPSYRSKGALERIAEEIETAEHLKKLRAQRAA
ncbi:MULTISPECIES: hypothetical protein [Enterobacter]|uniref:hypothetical protein n=1 Tax=Enterobacteriaceae TaxID=543 RepID=UPI0004A07A17|nr:MULTISPECIES: hypothetical protein [Enterobacter]KDM55332.1 hypothetical protein AF34_00845 [Enterobacter hormaechei subsp. hoffmannii]MBJ6473724.1 hypothetical protein [Enterobacter hormaechei]MBJ6515389.1 hypothetical protein [Enterobacter hormaechei]MBJ6533170.1 hypothetical protein [Enterobacter hormaechei]MBK4333962.1 hypothetical protein [Enterobacter hormaechei]